MNTRALVATSAFALASLTASLASAQTINLNTGFMPDPQRFPGVAGGVVSAQTVQADCRGWIPAQPSYVLQSPTGFRFLRIFAESGQDTTLMVRGVTGTWCADDTYGTNPGVDLRGLPPGRYDVYVGTYAQGQAAQYQLVLSELPNTVPGNSNIQPNFPPPGPGPGPGSIPGPGPGGGYGRTNLGRLDPNARPSGRPLNVPPIVRRPVAVMGRTNGEFDAASIRGEGTCRGWVEAAPSHLMMLRAPQTFLSLFVLSAADSTLIVRRPDGSLVCNDDRYGLNPGIQGSFPAGLYQIWVGTYREGENRPYRITVTADPNQHP